MGTEVSSFPCRRYMTPQGTEQGAGGVEVADWAGMDKPVIARVLIPQTHWDCNSPFSGMTQCYCYFCMSWGKTPRPSWPGSGSSLSPAGSLGTGRSPRSRASRGKWWRSCPPGCPPHPCGAWRGWWCGLPGTNTGTWHRWGWPSSLLTGAEAAEIRAGGCLGGRPQGCVLVTPRLVMSWGQLLHPHRTKGRSVYLGTSFRPAVC